uniref:Methylated-DNA--[protein]-cysteine S-methyltransferase n=1 Tax=candidate division WOR-3 bacterium TaxID=2052148 RepID=A0A7C4U715_UNCW3
MGKIFMSKDGNYQISIKTEAGYISIFSDGEKITELKFDCKVIDKPDRLLLFTKRLIQKYLKGENVSFERLKVKIDKNEEFYNFIRKIPFGERISYSEIGKKLAIHPRKVGLLLSMNKIPIIIPCHRVIYKDGRIGGFSAGKKWKKFLLKIEGYNPC